MQTKWNVVIKKIHDICSANICIRQQKRTCNTYLSSLPVKGLAWARPYTSDRRAALPQRYIYTYLCIYTYIYLWSRGQVAAASATCCAARWFTTTTDRPVATTGREAWAARALHLLLPPPLLAAHGVPWRPIASRCVALHRASRRVCSLLTLARTYVRALA